MIDQHRDHLEIHDSCRNTKKASYELKRLRQLANRRNHDQILQQRVKRREIAKLHALVDGAWQYVMHQQAVKEIPMTNSVAACVPMPDTGYSAFSAPSDLQKMGVQRPQRRHKPDNQAQPLFPPAAPPDLKKLRAHSCSDSRHLQTQLLDRPSVERGAAKNGEALSEERSQLFEPANTAAGRFSQLHEMKEAWGRGDLTQDLYELRKRQVLALV